LFGGLILSLGSKRAVPGFDLLSGPEREAIKDFLLLWSLYEGTMILDTSGSADAIVRAVRSLKDGGKLTLEPFSPAIKYFKERYYDGSDLTNAFQELRLRPNDRHALVIRMVRGQSSDDTEILVSCSHHHPSPGKQPLPRGQMELWHSGSIGKLPERQQRADGRHRPASIVKERLDRA
jgi:hypothetical protein